jgi:hypothetical protein
MIQATVKEIACIIIVISHPIGSSSLSYDVNMLIGFFGRKDGMGRGRRGFH